LTFLALGFFPSGNHFDGIGTSWNILEHLHFGDDFPKAPVFSGAIF